MLFISVAIIIEKNLNYEFLTNILNENSLVVFLIMTLCYETIM